MGFGFGNLPALAQRFRPVGSPSLDDDPAKAAAQAAMRQAGGAGPPAPTPYGNAPVQPAGNGPSGAPAPVASTPAATAPAPAATPPTPTGGFGIDQLLSSIFGG